MPPLSHDWSAVGRTVSLVSVAVPEEVSMPFEVAASVVLVSWTTTVDRVLASDDVSEMTTAEESELWEIAGTG
jgi:hypothetical protein